MLASAPAPVYDSLAFWAVVTFAVTAAAMLYSVFARHRGDPRRLLAYTTIASTPLVNSSLTEAHSVPVEVLIDHESVANPYISLLRVQNRSYRDIRSSDFDQGKPLRFDLGAELKFVVDAGSKIEYESTVELADRSIAIGPVLMKGGHSLQLTIITEGAPRITCRSPLVGVKVRDQAAYNPGPVRGRLKLAFTFAAIGFVFLAITYSGQHPKPNQTLVGVFLIANVVLTGAIVLIDQPRARIRADWDALRYLWRRLAR